MDIEIMLYTIAGPLILLLGVIAILIYFQYEEYLSVGQTLFMLVLATPVCIMLSILVILFMMVMSILYVIYNGLKYVFIKLR